jgi:hypothetical protein
MARVKGPLLSFDASGQLGKTVVYMNWKGIKDVRQHVIPANPKTEAQQAQRSKLAAAVERWHTYQLTELDKSAVNMLASLQPTPMSGFNVIIKADVESQIAGHEFQLVYGLAVQNITTEGFGVVAIGRSGGTYKIYYGTSPNVLTASANVTNNNGNLSVSLSGLQAGTTYYFQIRATDAGHDDVSGIGTATTAST